MALIHDDARQNGRGRGAGERHGLFRISGRNLTSASKPDAPGEEVTNSRLRRILRENGFVKVVGMNRVTEPWYAELAGKLGFDVIWFDMEHRAHSFEMVDRVSVACRASGIDLMVRIRNTGYTSAM